jgi:hypothetical protein
MELPITKEQAHFLNLVARAARVYRTACERIQSDMKLNEERLAVGGVPSAIRPNEAMDLSTSSAQLDMLEAALFTVFFDREGVEYGKIVRGYFKAAMTAADYDYIIAAQTTD